MKIDLNLCGCVYVHDRCDSVQLKDACSEEADAVGRETAAYAGLRLVCRVYRTAPTSFRSLWTTHKTATTRVDVIARVTE